MTKGQLVDRVKDLMQTDDRDQAARATEAVVEGLCGRISLGEVDDLNPYLGNLCNTQREEAPAERYELEDFVARVGDRSGLPPESAEQVARAVFRAIKEQIPEQQVRDVASQLPTRLKVAWVEA